MVENYDVIIVGGGIAGLIAACDLSREGLRTLVLEAESNGGGRARTREVDGFRFNFGPHALYLQGAFCAALDDLQISRPGREPVLNSPVTLWNDGKHHFPTSLGSVLQSTPLKFAERLHLAKLLRQVDRGDYQAAGQSLRTFTTGFTPNVRALLEALARLTTYSHAPEEIDAQAVLDQIRLSFGGVLYLDGGWGPVAQAIADKARAAGAEIVTGRRVMGIGRGAIRWRIFAEGYENLTTAAVIMTTEPAETAKLVQQSDAIRTAISNLKPARAVCLDIALSQLARPKDNFALGVDEPIYFSIHSTTACLAPPGAGLIHAARYLAPGEKPTAAHVDRLERLFELMQPGWRAFEVHRQRLLGMTVAHDIPQARTRGGRTPSVVHDAPGLFLAGDWIGSRGMLSDASAASARRAAQAARSYVSVMNEMVQMENGT